MLHTRTSEAETWLFSPVYSELLKNIKEGTCPLRKAFEEQNGFYVINNPFGQAPSARLIPAVFISDDDLPDPNVILTLRSENTNA